MTVEYVRNAVPGFTKKHRVHRLVYYEVHDDISEAIAAREAHQAVGTCMENRIDRETE
jgi:predicted GIY-YIG superfamily endonuclease